MSKYDNLLALDVGNTNTSIGIFDSGVLKKAFKVPSSTGAKRLWSVIEQELSIFVNKISKIAISSVVQGKSEELSDSLREYLAQHDLQPCPQVIILDSKTKWPMKSVYESSLGTDRILAAIAGVQLYGKPIVVVDIGSAVTIDFIDENETFKGGIILAGAKMRIQALTMFTSALPQIAIPETPPPLIGVNTMECMSSGIYHGMRQEIEGLVTMIQKKKGISAKVAVTGQGNQLFKQGIPSGWYLDDWLVIKGIYFTIEQQRVLKT